MSSSHKNAGNEYLVHTDANVVKTDAWSFGGTSARVKELEEELEQQKQALEQHKEKNTTHRTEAYGRKNQCKCLRFRAASLHESPWQKIAI